MEPKKSVSIPLPLSTNNKYSEKTHKKARTLLIVYLSVYLLNVLLVGLAFYFFGQTNASKNIDRTFQIGRSLIPKNASSSSDPIDHLNARATSYSKMLMDFLTNPVLVYALYSSAVLTQVVGLIGNFKKWRHLYLPFLVHSVICIGYFSLISIALINLSIFLMIWPLDVAREYGVEHEMKMFTFYLLVGSLATIGHIVINSVGFVIVNCARKCLASGQKEEKDKKVDVVEKY